MACCAGGVSVAGFGELSALDQFVEWVDTMCTNTYSRNNTNHPINFPIAFRSESDRPFLKTDPIEVTEHLPGQSMILWITPLLLISI